MYIGVCHVATTAHTYKLTQTDYKINKDSIEPIMLEQQGAHATHFTLFFDEDLKVLVDNRYS